MKQAFVSGGTGFLGRNLIDALLASGEWNVVALHRGSSTPEAREGVTWVEGRLGDRASLQKALPTTVDCVFHVAANTSIWRLEADEQYRDNVIGTRNLLRAAQERKARRFVHVSSQAAYGHHHGTIDESAVKDGAESWNSYTRTKALAEEEVKRAAADGLPAVIINPGHILGPYDRHNWSRMIRMVAAGTLPGVPAGAGSFCDARAVAKAMIAAAERGRPGENYLLGGADATFLEVVQEIGKLTGKRVPKRALPSPLLWTIGYAKLGVSYLTRRAPDITPEAVEHVMARMYIKSDKAERELGYQPVPLSKMLADSYEWLKAEGLLPN